jgi:hypothetical protein
MISITIICLTMGGFCTPPEQYDTTQVAQEVQRYIQKRQATESK